MATRNWIRFFEICLPVLILLTLAIPQLAQAQWQATVGAQSGDLAKQAMAFLPSEMWIHAGDSITWTFDSAEPHTVSFLKAGRVRPPDQVGCPGFSPDGFATFDGSTCVTTGRLKEGQTFTVTFPTANNFKLVCLIHRNMTATVHVLGLSEPLPHDQAFYDKQAQQERVRLLSAIDLGSHDEQAAENHVHACAGVISATLGGSENVVVMRFDQEKAFVHAGETVEWSNSDPTASHTITFGVEPADPMPSSSNVTLDSDGARHAMIIQRRITCPPVLSSRQRRSGLASLSYYQESRGFASRSKTRERILIRHS